MSGYAERFERVTATIAEACARAGREPSAVTLLAVSKEQPDEGVRALHALGVCDFGENKVQALAGRVERVVLGDVRWHLIGPLQTNKVKDVARLRPALLHSVDRVELAAALAKRLTAPLACLVQVNVDREPQKAGALPEELGRVLDAIAEVPLLSCHGLMAIPRPLDEAGEAATRAAFDAMRRLLDEVRPRLAGAVLSLGMSDDYALAIEHGATLVRIGSALFGPRPS